MRMRKRLSGNLEARSASRRLSVPICPGHLEDGGEFTEKGYQDERFRDPNYQVAKRYDLPDAVEGQKTEEHEKRERISREPTGQ